MHLKDIVNWSGKEDSEGCEAFYNSIVEAAMRGEAVSAGGSSQ